MYGTHFAVWRGRRTIRCGLVVQYYLITSLCQAGGYIHAHELRLVWGLRTPHPSNHMQWPAVEPESCSAVGRGAPHTSRIALPASIRIPCRPLWLAAVGVHFTAPYHIELVTCRDMPSFQYMPPRFGKAVPVRYVLLADGGHLIVDHATVLRVLAVDTAQPPGTATGVLQ